MDDIEFMSLDLFGDLDAVLQDRSYEATVNESSNNEKVVIGTGKTTQTEENMFHVPGSKFDENEVTTIIEDVCKVMSAANVPVVIEKDQTCYTPDAELKGYHLSTRKGTRSLLARQDLMSMETFLNDLLKKIDQEIRPSIDDDDIGGKWIQSTYCSSTYDFENLIFHLTPNRSLDYIDDFKEIYGYMEKNNENHEIVEAVLDAKCTNGDGCWYKTLFYPHIQTPGPILLPVEISMLLESKRHGLTLFEATALIDLLCSHMIANIENLDLRTKSGGRIDPSRIKYQTDLIVEDVNVVDQGKWTCHICICCLFMKQIKIGIQAESGNWVQRGSGKTKDDPLETITLIGLTGQVKRKNVNPDFNILSNCININGYNITRFIRDNLSIFNQYKIEPVQYINLSARRYQVRLKHDGEL